MTTLNAAVDSSLKTIRGINEKHRQASGRGQSGP